MNQFNYETFKKVLNIMEEQVPKRKIRYDDWEYAFNIYMLGKDSISWNTIALNQLATVLLEARINYLETSQENAHNEKRAILKSDLDVKEEPMTLNIEGLKTQKKDVPVTHQDVRDISIKLPPKSAAQQKEILKIIKESAKKVKENKVVEYQKRTSKETLQLISELLITGKYLRKVPSKSTQPTDLSLLESKVLQMIQGMEQLQKEFNERIELEKANLQTTADEIKKLLGVNPQTPEISLIEGPKKVR